MGKRKRHSPEFKREAVRSLEARGARPVSEVAAELGVNPTQLHTWKRQHEQTKFAIRNSAGETAEQEVKRLRKENRELRLEKEILKKAAAFFAKETN